MPDDYLGRQEGTLRTAGGGLQYSYPYVDDTIRRLTMSWCRRTSHYSPVASTNSPILAEVTTSLIAT
eukprot:scaffold106738_cov25-Prasinocladus_malaysianus.AAC.2